MYEKRVFIAEVYKQYELEAAHEDYEREKALAMQQYEAKELELKECLLNDLQDKRKAYDNYRHNLDLSSAGIEGKGDDCLSVHVQDLLTCNSVCDPCSQAEPLKPLTSTTNTISLDPTN